MVRIKAIVSAGRAGKTQEKTVEPSSTDIEVTADKGYSALSKVIVSAVKLQDKSVKSSNNTQYITADSAYNGISQVTVDPIKLQAKSVSVGAGAQTVKADNNYDGLESVAIEPAKLQEKAADAGEATKTITPDEDYIGLSKVTVNALKLQSKKVTAGATDITVAADENYDGLKTVSVNAVKLQDKEITLTEDKQTIKADEGFVGLNSVTVNVESNDNFVNYAKFTTANGGVYKFSSLGAATLSWPYGSDDKNPRVADTPNNPTQTLQYGGDQVVKMRLRSRVVGYGGTKKPQLREVVFTVSEDDRTQIDMKGAYSDSEYSEGFNNFAELKIIVVEHENIGCSDISGLVKTKSAHFQAGGDGAIYVPDSAVGWYKTATNWSTFADFIKPISEYKGWTLEDD